VAAKAVTSFLYASMFDNLEMEVLYTTDGGSVVNTTGNVNQMEFYIKNNDNNKLALIDRVYVVVSGLNKASDRR
jgi:hypothetical protein